MSSYFDEHATTDRTSHPNFLLELARLLLSSDDLIELASAGFDELGSPPASKNAVQALPTVSISDQHLKEQSSSSCPICLGEFKKGEKAKQMPCEHIFHKECILPWLEKTNSCPVCRHELPTDNEQYEELRNLKKVEKDRQHRVESLHSSMFS